MEQSLNCSKTNMSTLETLALNISNWIDKHGIHNFHLSKLKHILEEYNGTDWSACSKSLQTGYCRHKQEIPILYCCDVFDIFILTWRPNATTPVHNHPNTGCIYKVLQGQITEEIYDPLHIETKPIQKTSLRKGDCGYIDDNVGYHRIYNATNELAVSIHIYQTGYKPQCFNSYDIPS